MDPRWMRMTMVVAVAWILSPSAAWGWENLVRDPGFEAYRLNPDGYYELPDGAAWREITFGRGSVQFDANDWTVPDEMRAERAPGFTPATTGYEGQGPTENTGRMILEQDIVDARLTGEPGRLYEAWVWLGGAGRDDDNGADRKEEAGGWDIWFYPNDDPTTWDEIDAIETHRMNKDYWGDPGGFVRVHGYGRIPEGTRGARLQICAGTWGNASGPTSFPTEVALDNAHFAVIEAENALLNGDFELDDRTGEFKGWSRPAEWPFPRNGLQPLDVNNVFGENFDHGVYRPFYGGRWAYGYATYLRGWVRDAFTFGQHVDHDHPDGTPMMLLFHWIQGVGNGGEAQLRIIGTRVEVVAEFVGDDGPLGARSWWLDWPVPSGTANVCRYDQNSPASYCPRLLFTPPDGTRRIGVHVNFMVDTPYRDGWRSINAAVDEFFLGPAEAPSGSAR